MRSKQKGFLAALALLWLFSGSGCGESDLYDYSSPEATYRTYLEQARTLSIVADTRHYRRAIRCFTDSDWKWFEKNYESLSFEREDHVYNNLYKTKRLAYVFGRAVVPAGPSLNTEDYVFHEVSPGLLELEAEGYPERIRFTQTRRGWVMEGLFGLRTEGAG